MEVNFSFPAKTVPEFINYARANPGKISFAWRRYRTASLRRAFRYDHRYRYIYVAYRGDIPAVTDLLAGHVDQLPASIEHVRAGRLRGLAVTSAERIPGLSDIPTLGEFLPGFEYSGWFGIGAPRNTPVEIIEKLNREINAALGDSRVKSRIADLGPVAFPTSTAEFAKLIAADTEKWVKVIRAANIKL